MRAIDRPLGWRPSSASHSVYQAFDLIARAICGDADEIDLAIRVIGRHMCNFDWQKPWLIGMQQRYPSVARISGQLCNQVGNSHGASQLETPFSLRTLDMHQRGPFLRHVGRMSAVGTAAFARRSAVICDTLIEN
jgi:hypothetical protein